MLLIKKFLFSCVFILLGFILFSESCQAEEQIGAKGFSVNPFFQEIKMEEGQREFSFDVEVANNTGSLAVLKLSVIDFGALDESGGVAFLGTSEDISKKYALASWISLEKDGLVIDSGEKQSIKVTIQNKESLAPGGHYAALMFSLDPENNPNVNPSEVSLDPSFSSLIFVRKIGGEIFGLNLKEHGLDNGIVGLPSKFKLRFQNTGNVHLTPRGILKINDPLGREVALGIINKESSLILPETFRIFPIDLQKISVAFVPGRYKLTTAYRYDGNDDFITEQQNIFIIPAIDLWIIFIFAVIIFVWIKIKRKIV